MACGVKSLFRFFLVLLAASGFLFGIVNAATIVLKDGVELEDAKIVGESPTSVFVEQNGEIKTYARKRFPAHWLNPDFDPPAESETLRPAAAEPVRSATSETSPPPAAAPEPVASTQSGPELDPVEKFKIPPPAHWLQMVEAASTEAGVEIVDAVRLLSAMDMSARQIGFLVGYAVVVVALLSVACLLGALLLWLFLAIMRVPEIRYWSNYGILWKTVMLSIFVLLFVAWAQPGFFEIPYLIFLVPPLIGVAFACGSYPGAPFRAALAYLMLSASGFLFEFARIAGVL